MKKKFHRGVCRICGCTASQPCMLQLFWGGGLLGCGWANKNKTLCTNPDCLRKAKEAA